MQVDSTLHSQYSLNSAFEDFFNIELFGNQSYSPTSAQNSTGRSSSNSPEGSLSGLPPTPPPDADAFFNFYPDEELVLTKSDSLIPDPTVSSFDLFEALSNNHPYSSTSQTGTMTSSDDVATPPTLLAIDPQLVRTSSASNAASEMDEDEHHSPADPVDSVQPAPEDAIRIPPYKVGGKGKSSRKGTVQGGGVVKKSSVTKERALSSFPQSPSDDMSNNELDDGRPPPEEYKKLSSKEKRQLRNKISARNFRVRRKEYITTLETDIAERDRLIDAIRGELGSTKSENNALREEIDTLKKSLLAAQPTPVLPPPAPLPPVSAAASVAARTTTSPSPLLAPNTNKDLPSSPRLANARAGFWGGQGSSPFGTMGGFTPVHTTLVPDWSISGALVGKGLVTPPDSPPFSLSQRSLQENINPALNNADESTRKQQSGNLQPTNVFDSFADVNPFTMKTLDMYRTQLWTRLIQQRAPQRQQKQASSQPPPLTGLAASLRPHYFAATGKQSLNSNTSTSLSTLLSGKGVTGLYPTPPPSPHITSGTPQKATVQEAALASLASQTLMGKLGSAFWDAFAGQSSVACSSCMALDVDKVRRVLEGKAVLRIVDIDEPLSSRSSSSSPKFVPSSPKISPQTSSKPVTKPAETKDKCKVTDLLEESMKSLSISKRGPY